MAESATDRQDLVVLIVVLVIVLAGVLVASVLGCTVFADLLVEGVRIVVRQNFRQPVL